VLVTQGGRSPDLPGTQIKASKRTFALRGLLPHFLLIEPDSSAFNWSEGSDDAEENSASRKISPRRE
jgi:hypothetical protein